MFCLLLLILFAVNAYVFVMGSAAAPVVMGLLAASLLWALVAPQTKRPARP